MAHRSSAFRERATTPRLPKTTAKTRELVIKVVNGTEQPYRRSFAIDGATSVMPTGRVITLSGNAQDENTFDQPTKLAPQTTLYGKFGKQFSYEFAPMSFTIMRVKVED